MDDKHTPLNAGAIEIIRQLRAQLAARDAQIAELESQLTAQREQIERLLAECAHS